MVWMLACDREGNEKDYRLLRSIDPTFLPEILPAIEVGWRLDPDVWGKGYATGGASRALDNVAAKGDDACPHDRRASPSSEGMAFMGALRGP